MSTRQAFITFEAVLGTALLTFVFTSILAVYVSLWKELQVQEAATRVVRAACRASEPPGSTRSYPIFGGAGQAQVQAAFGYIFFGLMLFGIVFSVAYRITKGVQRIMVAKKVPAPVKKTIGKKKTIGGTGKKTPISKDIPMMNCPVCKAKIGFDSEECPYCHKKFNNEE